MRYWNDKQLKDDAKIVNAFRIARDKLDRLSNLSTLDIGDATKILSLIDQLDKISEKYKRTMKNQNVNR